MYLNLLFMFSYASRNRIINCIKNILIEINQTSEFNSILSFYSHCSSMFKELALLEVRPEFRVIKVMVMYDIQSYLLNIY